MTTFKYIGGTTYTEFRSDPDYQNFVDERKGVALPDVVEMYGHKFIIGQPVEVKRAAFRSAEQHAHAIAKLRKHPHFEEIVVEDAVVEYEEPKKRPGRKPKALEVQPAE